MSIGRDHFKKSKEPFKPSSELISDARAKLRLNEAQVPLKKMQAVDFQILKSNGQSFSLRH